MVMIFFPDDFTVMYSANHYKYARQIQQYCCNM